MMHGHGNDTYTTPITMLILKIHRLYMSDMHILYGQGLRIEVPTLFRSYGVILWRGDALFGKFYVTVQSIQETLLI